MNNTSAAYFFTDKTAINGETKQIILQEFIISKAVNPASKTSLLPITSI